MNTTSRVFLAALASAAIMLSGCESTEENGSYWKTKEKSSTSNSSAETVDVSASTAKTRSITAGQSSSADEENGGADEVSFSSLNWVYGGVDGSGARKTSASIGGLRVSGEDLYFSWIGDSLSVWTRQSSDSLVCFFVKRGDGQWVGGKFDWLNTSRAWRPMENVTGGYKGWSLRGVSNPCECAYVILSKDCSTRTNVIKGTWYR